MVIELHDRVAEETSGRNSGVLHSGIHEHPRSLKGKLAREGSALAVSYALEHGIPLLRTGMVIAISWRMSVEVSGVRYPHCGDCWLTPAKTNTPVSFVTPSGLRAWEPNLRACCGIVIPSVSVIDPWPLYSL